MPTVKARRSGYKWLLYLHFKHIFNLNIFSVSPRLFVDGHCIFPFVTNQDAGRPTVRTWPKTSMSLLASLTPPLKYLKLIQSLRCYIKGSFINSRFSVRLFAWFESWLNNVFLRTFGESVCAWHSAQTKECAWYFDKNYKSMQRTGLTP